MAQRYLGGLLSTTRANVNSSGASGLYSLAQQFNYQSSGNWPLLIFSYDIQYLIVAGGGGGGGNGGGGGGAGGVLQGTINVPNTLTFPVVVGSGGPYYTNGGDSSLINATAGVSLTAIGGGRGANRDGTAVSGSGGSGGGGSAAASNSGASLELGSPGTAGQGNSGGNGTRSVQAGGGGGGAGSSGGNYSGTTGGTGGNGILSDISGVSVGYAGGGTGSGLDYSSMNGTSGLVHYSNGIWYGGGGWQTQFTLGQRDGRMNSGGGGGGLGDGNANAAGQSDSGGGSGGSGVVILRYSGAQKGYGGIVTSVGGNTIHTFNQPGYFYTYIPTNPIEVNTNGLVLHFDGADSRSFPGPNTTRLAGAVGMNTNTTWYNLVSGTNGTISNADLYSARYGGGIYFNGTSHEVTVGSLGSGFSNITVEVWFRPDSVSNYRNVLDCNYAAAGNNVGPRLEMNSSGALGWTWGSSSNNYQGLSLLSSGLSTSNAYCAVFTRSGSTGTAYLNGSQTATAQETHAFTGTVSNLVIGRGFSSASERMFNGSINVVRIYNRALTAAEILNNYNAQKVRFGY
jgi:hypothetical protein